MGYFVTILAVVLGSSLSCLPQINLQDEDEVTWHQALRLGNDIQGSSLAFVLKAFLAAGRVSFLTCSSLWSGDMGRNEELGRWRLMKQGS